MLKLASPIVLTQVCWVGMMTTDAAMIGRLGPVSLAGVSLAQVIYFTIFVVCFGFTLATAGLASQAFGARRPRQVRRVIRQGLWIAILLSVPSCLVLFLTADILTWLQQPADATAAAGVYATTLLWSMPFAIAFNVLRNFVSALNRPKVAMWVMTLALPINALLDYALIFGNFGLPRLELFGAGLATSIVNALMFVLLAAICVFRAPFRRYNIFGRFWVPDWQVFREIFRVGGPIAGLELLEAGFFITAALLMGLIGTLAIAAHQIAIQVPFVTFMIPMGLQQAATVRVGHAAGRRDARGAYRAGWVALAMTLVFMSAMSVLILLIPEHLVRVFLNPDTPNGPEVLALAVSFLLYAAIFQVADGIQAVAAGALRGLNDTAMPMWIALISFWAIGFASSISLAFWLGLEGAGLWIGFVIGLVIASVLLTWRFGWLGRRGYLPDMLPEDLPPAK